MTGARLGTVAAAPAVAELWYAMAEQHAADVERLSRDCLSGEEQTRLRKYRLRGVADRYVITRALVRTVLGQKLGVNGRELAISRTDTGKPIVAQGIHFNVSHTGDLILLALSEQRDVGVDVERRRPVAKVEALIARWLDDGEKANLSRFMEQGLERSEAFLRIWSVKEARLKALGVGISGAGRASAEHVDVVSLDALLEPVRSESDAEGYVGALAFA